jgi:hypothetical protein
LKSLFGRIIRPPAATPQAQQASMQSCLRVYNQERLRAVLAMGNPNESIRFKLTTRFSIQDARNA